jgi:hypothetical protein
MWLGFGWIVFTWLMFFLQGSSLEDLSAGEGTTCILGLVVAPLALGVAWSIALRSSRKA